MPGQSFRAPAGLRVGDVVNGWALKISDTTDGPACVGEHDLKIEEAERCRPGLMGCAPMSAQRRA